MKLNSKLIIFTFFFCILGYSNIFAEGGEDQDVFLPRSAYAVNWDSSCPGYCQHGHYRDANDNNFLALRSYYETKIRLAFFQNKLYELFGFSTTPQYLVKSSKVYTYGYDNEYAIVMKDTSLGKPLGNFLEEAQEKMPEQLAKLHLIATLVGDLSILKENGGGYGAFIDGDRILIGHNCIYSNKFEHRYYNNPLDLATVSKNLLYIIRSEYNYDPELKKIAHKIFHIYTTKHLNEIIAWLDHSWDEQKITTLFQESGLKDEKILANLKLRFQDLKKNLEEAKAVYWSYLPSYTYLPSSTDAIQWNRNGSGCCEYGHYVDENNSKFLAISDFWPNDVNLAFFKNKLYGLFGFATAPQYLVARSAVRDSNYADKKVIVMKGDTPGKPLSTSLEEAQEKMPEQLAQLFLMSVLVDDLTILTENNENYGAFIDNDHLLISHNCKPGNSYPLVSLNILSGINDNLLKRIRSADSSNKTNKIAQKIFKNCTEKHLDAAIAWLNHSWDEQKVITLFQESGLKDEKILTNLKLRFQDLRKSLEEAKTINWSYLPPSTDAMQWNRNGSSYDYEYAHYVDENNNTFLAIKDYWSDSPNTNLAFFKNKLYELFGFATRPQYLVPSSTVHNQSNADKKAIVIKGDTPGKPLSTFLEETQEKMPEQLAQLFLMAVLVDDIAILSENNENYGAFIDNDRLLINHNCNPNKDYSNVILDISSTFTDSLLERIRSANSSNKTNKIAQKILKNYTSKHPDAAIAWLDHSWDEQKVTTLFRESGLKDEKILTNLKLRFENLKKDLQTTLEKEKTRQTYAAYLPIDSSKIIWNTTGPYSDSYATYTAVNQDKIFAVRSYGFSEAIFKKKLYEMLGFSTIPQYLADIDDFNLDVQQNSFSANSDRDILIVKVNPTSKPLNKCNNEEIKSKLDEIAKLHIIATITDDLDMFTASGIENYGAFIDNGRLLIGHFYQGNKNHGQTPMADKELLKKSLAPQYNWEASKITQKIFQEYTLKHIPEIIAWLDSHWDEVKIDTLFTQNNITNQQASTRLKQRFRDIRNDLAKIEKEGYEPYSYEKISSLIKNKKAQTPDGFSVKNVYYKHQESILPKTTEQLALCSNENKVWLEITNFEFLVNGKKSNKIVKIYIGDVAKKDSLVATEKQIIEIFDPETAFIFSDAVIRYWDALPTNTTEDSYQKLSKAIIQGYLAIGSHFGVSYKSKLGNPTNPMRSFKNLTDFCDTLQEEYHTAANTIGRFVPRERLNQLRELGFEAYYPNPIYLGDIAQYARPSEISYDDYVSTLGEQSSLFNTYNKDYLSKSADINYKFCDDYTRPIEKWYPRDICFADATAAYSANDYKRVSAYTFRGDNRDISDIYKDTGFWTIRCNGLNTNGTFDGKKCKEQILNDANSWQIHLCGNRPCPGGNSYVSTSKAIDVTKSYGTNVYAVFAEGGIHLPSDFNGTKVYDSVSDLKEIAVPGGIPWKNTVGMRTRYINDANRHVHSEGPVFLKNDLAENDRTNFWEILQIMGEKPQGSDLNSAPISQLCLSALAKPDDSDLIAQSIKKILVYRLMQEDGVSKEIAENQVKDFKIGEICELTLQNTIDLEHKVNRKSYLIPPSVVESIPVNVAKFWNTLSTQEVNGKEIIEQLSQDKNLKNLFEKSAGVGEGYTIQEHTLMVFGVFKEQFDNYKKHFKFNVPSDIRLFETLKMAIALHDIGKPLAVERNNQARQHDYTIPILKSQLKNFNFSTNEINFVQSLVGHDIIGELIQQKISLEEAKSRLQITANNANMSLHDFLPLQLLFYTIDAASYPQLRKDVFTQNNGLLVSNNPKWGQLINMIRN